MSFKGAHHSFGTLQLPHETARLYTLSENQETIKTPTALFGVYRWGHKTAVRHIRHTTKSKSFYVLQVLS
jgi:hypothetical protein